MGEGKRDILLYRGIWCGASPDISNASSVDAGCKTETGGAGFALIVEARISSVGLGDASGPPPFKRVFFTGGTTSTAITPGFGIVPAFWNAFHSALVRRRTIGVCRSLTFGLARRARISSSWRILNRSRCPICSFNLGWAESLRAPLPASPL